MIGSKLAQYTITNHLGSGGMGEVYQATDSRLGRSVAIKLLPEVFMDDSDRATRFEREARALAALNHPNIATIYGIEESAGRKFLVMELVPGETLAERIRRGAIPIEEALGIAVQIADALEAAHEKGIIHRDLKPANIKLTEDGKLKVKVLDFGLAKSYASENGNAGISNSPTVSLAETQKGLVLGTAAYMSPEQAKGQPVDKRTDIWGFGCVLTEMLTGHAAFSGDGLSDLLAAVLRGHPDFTALPANLNPRLREVLERCLEKDVHKRFRDIGDVRADLQKISTDPQGLLSGSPAMRPQGRSRMAAVTIAAVLLAMAGSGIAAWKLKPSAARPITRFIDVLPEEQSAKIRALLPRANVGIGLISLSADGSRIVYSDTSQIYMRRMDEMEARPIQGAAGIVFEPAFSADGHWLIYAMQTGGTSFALKKIPVTGGTPTSIAEGLRMPPLSVRWDERDRILFVQQEGVMEVSANGGKPTLVLAAAKGETLMSPQHLPGGNSILFTTTTATGTKRWDTALVQVYSPASGSRTTVWSGGNAARYVPTGNLVFVQGATLFAVPFDLGRLKTTGGQVPMVEGVLRDQSGTTDTAQYAVSESGALAYLPGDTVSQSANGSRTLVWVDEKGVESPVAGTSPQAYFMARISPDGKKAVLGIRGNHNDLWSLDLERSALTQLTFDAGGNGNTVWSRDSSRIFFSSTKDPSSTKDQTGIYSIPVNGGKADFIAGPSEFGPAYPWSLYKDGKTLALITVKGSSIVHSLTLLLDGAARTFEPLLTEDYVQTEPGFSPNGNFLVATEGIVDVGVRITVRPYPNVRQNRMLVGIGRGPVFSGDGSRIFYLSENGISAANVEYGPGIRIDKPQLLFSGAYRYGTAGVDGSGGRAWDPDPNGKRFLMIKPQKDQTSKNPIESGHQINVVLNWFDELKAKAATP
jgi:serine/threonine protein kinase/Tol biopolymer transport system component